MREIMRGISSVLDAAGVSTSLFLTRPEDTHAPSNSVFFQALSEHRVDGVISTYYVGREGYLRMLELGMPLVLTFDYDGLDLPLACVDSLHLFEEVASLVVEAGWRLPALVKGPGLSRTEELTGADSPLTGFRAVEGFRSGLVRHGLPHHPSHVIRSNYRPEEAGGLAAEVRRLAPEPDVLIVDGVEIASALRELLPHRIAVVGLGPRSGPPGIGVVEVPSYQIGRKAAEMLRRRMDAPTAPVEQEYIRLDVAKARASVFSAYERLVGRHATPQA
jgi:DNA-binding LacI/PurR family transcriptional regulator